MKKTLLIIVAFVSVLNYLNAQGYEKPVVYIDYFTRPANISVEYAEALRGKIIEGLHATNRIQLIDVASESKLSNEEERRKAESAMSDATARVSQMNTLGANYIITGEIVLMDAAKKVDEKDNVSYRGSVQWNVKVIDATTGTLKKTENYEHKGFTGGSGDTPLKAIMGACDYARINMSSLAEEVFPIEGTVLKIETVNKKGDKAESVIIDLGTSHGISKGQRMRVFMEIDIAGEVGQKEIGTLNANEILSAGRSICKVSKGGDHLLKAMNAGQKVIVQTREKGLLEF